MKARRRKVKVYEAELGSQQQHGRKQNLNWKSVVILLLCIFTRQNPHHRHSPPIHHKHLHHDDSHPHHDDRHDDRHRHHDDSHRHDDRHRHL